MPLQLPTLSFMKYWVNVLLQFDMPFNVCHSSQYLFTNFIFPCVVYFQQTGDVCIELIHPISSQ